MLAFTDRIQQGEVLHVARADLQHIGVGCHQPDLFGGHYLGDDRHARFLADFSQDLQAFLAQALEGIRRGTGFICPAPQDGRPGFFDGIGHL